MTADTGTVTREPRNPENMHSADARWMRQALTLAEESVGLASPNPVVGCMLVKDGLAIGRGAHVYDALHHAEIVALIEAGEQARGATAYVTLEPCSHTGRTGPCADALIRAGVARVVIATGDPNPLVSGRGISRLREAGVAVAVGVLGEEARALNDGFARSIRHGLPFVTLKAGLSLDGRIAPAPTARQTPGSMPGSTTYLTSPESLAAVQRLRHASDAVITGIGTVLSDDPLLTDRSGLPRRRPLLRVVLDSALRLPVGSRLVESAHGDLLVYTADGTSEKAEALRNAGVEVEQIRAQGQNFIEEAEGRLGEHSGDRLDLRTILVSLGERRGILNLLAEGGSRLNRILLGAGLVDKLCLFYAPVFLGEHGAPLIAGPGSLSPQMTSSTLTCSGVDLRFEAYLRDPWD